MRKVLLGLTTAVALGALAIPGVASAAQNHGGVGGGSRGAGITAHSFSGARVNANVGGTRNFAVRNNVRNFAVNNNAQRFNGQHWASNDRHHHRNGWLLPFAAFGAYAAYDQCWQTEWTPAGYQRVYVCGPDGYGYN
jgi:hypothetical protein